MILFCDDAVVEIWLGLGTKTTSGRDQILGLGENYHLIEETWGWLTLGDPRGHGNDNNHMVKVKGRL